MPMPVRLSRSLSWRLVLAVTLSAVALMATLAGTASAAVPQGFVGVDMDGPLFAPNTSLDLNNQMDQMVASGVQSVRVAFNWAAAQPYSSWSQVPFSRRADFIVPEPRPTDFSTTDEIVQDAAIHGLTVLPTILYAPGWDAKHTSASFAIPRRAAPYAQYAADLVGRYGPNGSFWTENPQIPKMPIRAWQIWNEPNLPVYWPQPFARSYVGLLSAAHAAIRHADPGAKVVLGALTNYAWTSLDQIYRIRGARKTFDVASVNGFTASPSDVITYLRLVRAALGKHRDGHKPLLATELSWPSSQGQSPETADFDTTEAGQASNIAGLLPRLGRWRRRLGLAGFYYYTWIGQEYRGAQEFNFAGLLKLHAGQVTAKPALAAFSNGALALEQCRSKGTSATVCLH